MSHDPDIAKSPFASYTPRRSPGVTVVVPAIVMPGIAIAAFSRTSPTSIGALVRADRNSMRKLLAPCRSSPAGFESVIAKSPARTVCSTAPVDSGCGAAAVLARSHHPPAAIAMTRTTAAGTQRGTANDGVVTGADTGRRRYSLIQ